MKTLLLIATVLAAPLITSVTASAQSCREGSVEIFLEGSETTTPVYYVCKHGEFKRMYGATRERARSIRTCREGRTEMFLEGVDNSVPVQYVCHNGRFVRAH